MTTHQGYNDNKMLRAVLSQCISNMQWSAVFIDWLVRLMSTTNSAESKKVNNKMWNDSFVDLHVKWK